jgi:hypothetical protein
LRWTTGQTCRAIGATGTAPHDTGTPVFAGKLGACIARD